MGMRNTSRMATGVGRAQGEVKVELAMLPLYRHMLSMLWLPGCGSGESSGVAVGVDIACEGKGRVGLNGTKGGIPTRALFWEK